MSNIKAIDFANNVEQNRQSIIQHCKENSKPITNNASLSEAVAINNTITNSNETRDYSNMTRRVFNYDGTLLEEEIIDVGDEVYLPDYSPTISDPLIEFDRWVCTTTETTVTTDYDIAPTCRVKEQIDVNGTLVRPSILDVYIPANTTVSIRWWKNASASVVYLDWGDETIDTISSGTNGTVTHTYSNAGQYLIKMYSTTGYCFYSSSSNDTRFIQPSNVWNGVVGIYWGDNYKSLSNTRYDLTNCKTFIIPYNLEVGLETSAYFSTLSNLYGLKILVLRPKSYTTKETSSIRGLIVNLYCPIVLYNAEGLIQAVSAINTDKFILPYGVTDNLFDKSTQYYTQYRMSFGGSYRLKKLVYPSTWIGEISCSNAYTLENVILGNTKELTANCFQNTYSLKNLIIPSSVTTIGASAISGCAKNVTISSMPTSIASGNITGQLKSISVPSGWKNSISLSGMEDINVLLSLAKNLKDLTGETAQVLNLRSEHIVEADIIKVDEFGNEDENGLISLTEYITGKNWTITLTIYQNYNN